MAETDDAPDPLLGRLVGQKFLIERLLGAGAMGRVYLAEQTNLGKQIALKVLHNSMAGDASLAKRFYREAKSASMLAHPNILQIIDFGDDAGLLFIAMELLSGRDLYRAIKQDWPMSLDRVGHIGSQILSALDEAHAKGVIHRDLKPENVMLLDVRGESDFVKVCDFGIAKVASERDGEGSAITVAGMVCGTPEYMSPEQAKGETLDGRSDLYAAATILYQMVAGDVPFRAESALGVITKQLHEEPKPPSQRRENVQCPPALEALILRGLRKNKEERFANASDMKLALQDALGLRRASASGAPIARKALTDVAMAATGVSTPVPSANGASLSAHGSSPASSATSPANASAPVGAAPSSPAVAMASIESTGTRASSANLPAAPAPARSRGPLIVAAFAVVGVIATGGYLVMTHSASSTPATPSNPVPPNAAPPQSSVAPSIATPSSVPPSTAPNAAPSTPPTTASAPPSSPSNPAPSNPQPNVPTPPAQPVATPIPNAHVAPPPQQIAMAPHHHEKHAAKPSSEHTTVAAAAPAPSGDTPAAAVAPAAAAPAKPVPAAGAHTFAGAFADGEQLFRAGDVDGALARYQEAARLNPTDAKTQRQIGKCYNRLGQRDRAQPYIKRYLELAPNASDADFFRAQLDAK